MSPTDPSHGRLQELVFRYLEAKDSGTGPEALDALCRAHPELARELRGLVDELGEAGLVDPGDEGDGARGEHLGEFRLIKRLGAGGMGVVHLAEQVGLGRLVALKVVRPEQVFFESARLRFRREVESAARLTHSGIAAVYSFGEARGVPYFAQEYIPGASLDAVLRALDDRQAARLAGPDLGRALRRAMTPDTASPSDSATFFAGAWEEVCARIVLAAAEALEHAHSRGVLHRDVKPSNLLLVPSGRVVLVDFGLATIADGERLTRTGSVLGSMPYMAPEVLDGGDATVASDVYALGVTLYELATLSLPFVSNRVEELRRQVLEAAPLRPRVRNPELSRDLETIIACAMDRAPARRYATAEGLAADLRALLGRRPIAARPAGPWTRMVRLVERRPALVAAVCSTALLVVGVPTAAAIVQGRHVREVKLLNTGLEDALAGQRSAAARAEESYALAVQTVEHLLEQFSDRALTRYPVLAGLRLGAIDRAIETFEALRANREGDIGLVLETAKAYRARGDALYDLRRMEDSLAAQQRQNELLAGVCAEPGASAEAWHQLGIGRAREARALSQLRRHGEAVATIEAGLDATRRAMSLEPEDAELSLAFMTHQNNLAMNLAEVERYVEARAAYDACIADAERFIVAYPGEPRAHEVLGRALRHRFGRMMHAEGAPEQVSALRRAREAYTTALLLEPRDRGLREDIVHLDFDLADALAKGGDLAGAREVLEASAVEAGELAAEFPELPGYLSAELSVLGLLAHVTRLQGEWPAARDAMARVADRTGRLATQHANDPGSLMESLMAWVNLANFVVNSPDLGPERFEMCLAHLARADEVRARLDASTRDGIDGRNATFQIGYNRVLAHAQRGERTEAHAVARALSPARDFDPWAARMIADAWCEVRNAEARARVADAPGESAPGPLEVAAYEDALHWLERAVELGYADRAELESTPALEAFRAEPRFRTLLGQLTP